MGVLLQHLSIKDTTPGLVLHPQLRGACEDRMTHSDSKGYSRSCVSCCLVVPQYNGLSFFEKKTTENESAENDRIEKLMVPSESAPQELSNCH
jgi:hypothetical protein